MTFARLLSVVIWFWFLDKSWPESSVVCVESHDWLGCWGHHMKSPGFKTLGEHQKVQNIWRNMCCISASPLPQVYISNYWTSHHSCPSWTTSQEPSRSAGRTDCGEICPRCKVALANKSLASFPGLLFFLRTLSCSVRPGRTAAPGRNGSSNLYATLHRAQKHSCCILCSNILIKIRKMNVWAKTSLESRHLLC